MTSEELLRQYSELLTQRVSELLTSRLERLFPPRTETHSIRDEFGIVFKAAKGKQQGFWRSVFDVSLLLMERDYRAGEISKILPYNRITIYRALQKLEKQGFCVNNDGVWMVNEANCPILYWHSHDSKMLVVLTG